MNENHLYEHHPQLSIEPFHFPVCWLMTAPVVRPTFSLAVSAVLVVRLPQQLGQDGLVLLILFLGFFPLRPGRHVAVREWVSVPKSLGVLDLCYQKWDMTEERRY